MPKTTRKYVRRRTPQKDQFSDFVDSLKTFARNILMRTGGLAMIALSIIIAVSLASFSISDPSMNTATPAPVSNIAGAAGAYISDFLLQSFGAAAWLFVPPLAIWGFLGLRNGAPEEVEISFWFRLSLFPIAIIASAIVAAAAPTPATWPFAISAGGVIGDLGLAAATGLLSFLSLPIASFIVTAFFIMCALAAYVIVCGLTRERLVDAVWCAEELVLTSRDFIQDRIDTLRGGSADEVDEFDESIERSEGLSDGEPELVAPARQRKIIRKTNKSKQSKRERREAQPVLPVFSACDYEYPPLNLLSKPNMAKRTVISDDALEQNARMLETVLSDFGVRGEIINVRPGPVVTLYELEPAAGVKSSRVIGLADDIARSMSAVACRVALVPGRNVIGIELPNQDREMVFLRELLGASEYENSDGELTLSLGKGIGGEAVFADLARMPHLLIAGTTGSGKSVGINTMILSLLYRMAPDECKLILIDPKMLELSVYEGIPHLLAPVVTDPRKAVVALKWTVREMEERYRKMSKVGVRNIEGFNARVAEAEENGEILSRTVHTGYDEGSGEPLYETEELEFEEMPFIVVVIDEVADLMMVAGKDIEGMVQRLAQMARAAGIHLIMATQRPSVDVITGTIKANFPTRISFQVTSKIDSRTILGEQGAEQLLGQGDMLHMAGGGRLRRVHGAFVSDDEVEKIVKFLKKQGSPEYVQDVTEMRDDDGSDGGFEIGGNTSSGDALYDRAVAVVLRDRKASTSYVQRRLKIGYNRAATLIEQMEEEGIISSANHAGKREILVGEDAA
ncbi:MAG: hypothetical protein HKN14_11980 [Marinicaulis sp.]|nr:hypothetical protein [Marinicaulis sp.]NNL90212.1 hypothetical protein [Marinicaulis sp.]